MPIDKIINNENVIHTFPYEMPKAWRKRIVKTPVKPERPVPEPKVWTISEGSPLRYPIIVASPKAYAIP